MFHRTTTAALGVLALVTLAACGDDGVASSSPDATAAVAETGLDVADDTTDAGTTESDTTDDPSVVAVAAVDGLSADEVAGLIWMREEEQLAHDVYVTLGEAWDLRIFDNIADSEQSHVDAIVGLLDRYGLDDPASGNELGTFTDPVLQELYDDLVAQGLESVESALAVGATIEELDIVDLRERAAETDTSAIADVYAQLERGSRNHLRAFVGQLDLLGVDYEPTLLDDFEEIVTSATERGGGGGGHGGGNGWGNH